MFGITAPHGALTVCTDRRALTQILINLANNAIKFTETGRVNLTLMRRRDDLQCLTEFSVVDTGPGIALEDQAKLFQAFQQVGPSSSRRQEGTGLGLYLCQKLAGLLGGRVELQSEFGKGSTFRLVLAETL
jgi:two-component system, sensor histidine kinase and response regulator